jgi:hypothetical protein
MARHTHRSAGARGWSATVIAGLLVASAGLGFSTPARAAESQVCAVQPVEEAPVAFEWVQVEDRKVPLLVAGTALQTSSEALALHLKAFTLDHRERLFQDSALLVVDGQEPGDVHLRVVLLDEKERAELEDEGSQQRLFAKLICKLRGRDWNSNLGQCSEVVYSQ